MKGPLKHYIPKIDDLIEIIDLGKIHIFKGLVASRMFDLKNTSSSGESVASALEKKGAAKAPFTLILAECGVDLEDLAVMSFWREGLTAPQTAAFLDHRKKLNEAKRIEAIVVNELRRYSATLLSPKLTGSFCERITEHFPYINAERVLEVALAAHSVSVVTHLLQLGASATRCRSIAHYAHTLFDSPEEAYRKEKEVFAKKAPASRFHMTSYDSKRVEGPSRTSAKRLQKLGSPGLTELFLRSQLIAVWGISDWASTLDHFPRTDAAIYADEVHHFFDMISSLEDGFACNPIIITRRDMLHDEEKWKSICEEPERPLVIETGWDDHSCVVVITRGKEGAYLYKGNRAPASSLLDPGIYRCPIDPSKITRSLIKKIVLNTSPSWLEADATEESLERELEAKSRSCFELLPPQTHPNCAWSSNAELACYLLQRLGGISEEQAKIHVKTITAKIRSSLLLEYLRYDRSDEVLLHSPEILGAILAKCIVRYERDLELIIYKKCMQEILSSELSVDMMQLVYTLARKFYGESSLKMPLSELASYFKMTTQDLFCRLDPFYRPEERAIRKIWSDQAKDESQSLMFDERFPLMDWIKECDVPLEYKIAIIQELVPPLYAFSILTQTGTELCEGVRQALKEKVKRASLSDVDAFLRKYGEHFKKFSYPNHLEEYVSVLAEESIKYSKMPYTDETKAEIDSFYRYLVFVLHDPQAGPMLVGLLLQMTKEQLSKLQSYYPKGKVFPDDILLSNQNYFMENLPQFLAAPGWGIESHLRVLMTFLKKEPCENQEEYSLKIVRALEELEAPILAKAFLDELWKENPRVVQQLFEDWRRTERKEDLCVSDIFLGLVDKLWEVDTNFIKELLRRDLFNVNLWPKAVQEILQNYYIPDDPTKKVEFPPNVASAIMEKDLEDWERNLLTNFFTKYSILSFCKRKRSDSVDSTEEEAERPKHKPFARDAEKLITDELYY